MLLIFLSAAPMSKTWGWVQVCLNEWKWYFTAIQSSLLKHVRLKMLLWQFSINIRTLIIITLIINIDVQISQCSNGFFLVCGEFQNSIVSNSQLGARTASLEVHRWKEKQIGLDRLDMLLALMNCDKCLKMFQTHSIWPHHHIISCGEPDHSYPTRGAEHTELAFHSWR